MTRISRRFRDLRDQGEKALILYLTAGDPSLEKTLEFIPALEAAGADLLEIGVPFSDPTADGPAIQAASRRALENGTNLAGVLDLIAQLRRRSEIPVILFSYYNPIWVFGPERFARAAKTAGVDGVLVVDLPLVIGFGLSKPARAGAGGGPASRRRRGGQCPGPIDPCPRGPKGWNEPGLQLCL
jgi:tryptophan synthase alpha chain